MRIVVGMSLAAILGLAACGQQPAKPSDIGLYQIIASGEATLRINTVTGQTDMLVTSTTPGDTDKTYAMRGDLHWVWAEVPQGK